MNYILFDDNRKALLPLTYTRPVAELRCGILTVKAKWDKYLQSTCTYKTAKHLSGKFSIKSEETNTLINASILPTLGLVSSVKNLDPNQCLIKNEIVIAACISQNMVNRTTEEWLNQLTPIQYEEEIEQIKHPWDLFKLNGSQIKQDIELLGLKPNVEEINASNTLIGNQVYIEEGAKVNAVILNSENGPIYIGKDAEIMEGAIIRGPFAMGEHSVVKMGAKIYGDTSFGDHCKVGGEVSNVVMFSYSNKGHDGFIGNSVIGEWCNFGADTNSSNLKNNYSPVRVWSYQTEKMEETGLQFCGLIAGDHCKTGINTMLNTGTVLGVSANVFGGDFPPKFVPSFTWGGSKRNETFKLNKAFEVAQAMMARRKVELSQDDKNILQHTFLADALYRK